MSPEMDSSPITEAWLQLQGSLRDLLNWFLSPKSRGVEESDGSHAVAMIASHLAAGYQLSPREPVASGAEDIKFAPFDSDVYLSVDAEYRAPIAELGREAQGRMRPHLVDFLLHGSLATEDYEKGWSDFDTLAIVSRECLIDPPSLVSLRDAMLDCYHYLTDVDPLQHHGFLVMSEPDLLNYPPSSLPPAAIALSLSYLGKSSLSLYLADTRERELQGMTGRARFFAVAAKEGLLRHHPYKSRFLQARWGGNDEVLYQLKYLIGTIALAPAQLLGALGRHEYKREAIEIVKPHLSAGARQTLELTTEIRSEWPGREWGTGRGESNTVPRWVKNLLGPEYLSRAALFHQEAADLAVKGIT
jgi:hypothetical protein